MGLLWKFTHSLKYKMKINKTVRSAWDKNINFKICCIKIHSYSTVTKWSVSLCIEHDISHLFCNFVLLKKKISSHFTTMFNIFVKYPRLLSKQSSNFYIEHLLHRKTSHMNAPPGFSEILKKPDLGRGVILLSQNINTLRKEHCTN